MAGAAPSQQTTGNQLEQMQAAHQRGWPVRGHNPKLTHRYSRPHTCVRPGAARCHPGTSRHHSRVAAIAPSSCTQPARGGRGDSGVTSLPRKPASCADCRRGFQRPACDTVQYCRATTSRTPVEVPLKRWLKRQPWNGAAPRFRLPRNCAVAQTPQKKERQQDAPLPSRRQQ